MFSTAKDDDMVECPYNKYHQMTRKRLIPHLIKCRLSYPDAELIKCPFNASHLIPEPEFTHHVSNCKDKAIIHQYKYNTLPVKLDVEDRQQVEIDCDENWDDTEADDYDPKKYVSQANVIRSHIGDLPSVRKEFRKSERKRLGDKDSSDDEAQKTFGKRIYKDMDCKKKEEFKESKWFEDLGPSSSSKSGSQRRDSYQDSLKEFSKERGHNEYYNKQIIKKEYSDGEEDSNSRPIDDYQERKPGEDECSNTKPIDDYQEKKRGRDEGSSSRRRDYSPERRREENEGSYRRPKDDYPERRREENKPSHGRPKDDYPERRRVEREGSNGRAKDDYRERRRGEDSSMKRRGDDYPLDDDPYYKTHYGRNGFVGMSNRARRGRY